VEDAGGDERTAEMRGTAEMRRTADEEGEEEQRKRWRGDGNSDDDEGGRGAGINTRGDPGNGRPVKCVTKHEPRRLSWFVFVIHSPIPLPY
jgi:hypothetical protein